jgi:murein DD-endopeptidase MepM/ murein hydrolase activator NlpD
MFWDRKIIMRAVMATLIIITLAGCATRRRPISVSFEQTQHVKHTSQPIWPVSGAPIRITSRFGDKTSSGSGGDHIHVGIDFAAPKGTPVLSTGDGVVQRAESTSGGYGQLVTIQHPDKIETRYGHLSSIAVQSGQHVHKGQRIGAVGATGHATGNHLHYEIRVNGAPVDPLSHLPKTQ